MFSSQDRLVILDADGTLINAFEAMTRAFAHHDMDIGDLERFQRRRKLLKYLGGLREFPKNLRKQFGKQNRKALISTLTEIYRDEARLYPGLDAMVLRLINAPGVRVGIVTRNVTHEPAETLRLLLQRHEIDINALDFVHCLPLSEEKLTRFRQLHRHFGINPSRAYSCGDEYGDYAAAVGSGISPIIATYGFEDRERLHNNYNIPEDVMVGSPVELAQRLLHALDPL